MNITRNWKGDVLFLEDDHYVAPDIIYTLKHLRKMAPQTPRAHVLSVGNFNKVNPTFSNAVSLCKISIKFISVRERDILEDLGLNEIKIKSFWNTLSVKMIINKSVER